MTRKWILFCAIFLSLIAAGCKKAVQPNDQPETASETVSEKSSTKEKEAGNTPARIYARPEVPILCYHRIADGKKGDYTVSPATFSAHMKILADSGYHSISPAQLYDYLVYNKDLPKKPVMITFDDSRIEHIQIAAPVMEKNGFRGVFFIMTITYGKKNYMTTEQIAQLAKAGHTVGLHTWDHTMVTKYKDTTDWQKQIVTPKEKLEKIVGKPVEYFAYPNGVYDHKGAKELSKYFKLSFILTSKRDSIEPLQTVRRMIAPEWTAQGLLKSMRRTFKTL
ncbi:MAG: polysaccharide deacetylase family protein [Bacteroidales bacterium]|nr:polysaccharide deacetylase family protein [Bacteroidales bacterium]